MPTMTRTSESTAPTPCLLLAFELGRRTWKLGFSVGLGQRPRCRQIPAGAVSVLAQEISRAKVRLELPRDAAVMSCYEAGRDGFWLHRYLVAQGITITWWTPRALKSIGGPAGRRPIVWIWPAS
jgi:hypothetical protein